MKFLKKSKIKIILLWKRFLDFANISSYLQFKLSAWKRGYQYLLNCKCTRLHQPHFGKLLQSSTKESKNFSFSTIFNSKVLQLLHDCANKNGHAIDHFDLIQLHIFTHLHTASFLKHFCEINVIFWF